ncbi:hypothetical protein GIB67_032758 [Kingdonia uniflora]|uniref:Uncharacterized protein n=1 Tax=Kingdonia uniflora TaxID=39325 RepID=A0A7J7MW33_9MAGN|nr:hypothetical protein GIB67_032758 [Kingdonia uniflora]
MVTKSRLSPFANTKARRERKDFKKRLDFNDPSISNTSKPDKSDRWFTLINAAASSQKKALLPVKKLRESMLLKSELHRTLYGFIVFEVSWTNVRGINYLNELQTDTSMAIEAKFMKRSEFDSIEQALSCISSWFSGTQYELLLLREYLGSIRGEVFYDAQEDFSASDPTIDIENICGDARDCDKKAIYNDGLSGNISLYSENLESKLNMIHTPPPPPPPTGPYKRRKITRSFSFGSDGNEFSEDIHTGIVSSPRYGDNTVEAMEYRDVLILFKFNDHNLPFKLREIIMSNLRLLTLLESGLPSWVIFLQSYPVFCHFYRPWMCPLVRALYMIISVVTVLIGFYDLYKNVPVLKATASKLCGPLLDWIETWEMISRIKYLGTMLFLHNFEKSVKWFLMVTRSIRSFLSVFTQPMAGPFAEFIGILLPFWNICLECAESVCSVVWIAMDSSCSLVVNVVQILFMPLWFLLSTIWNIASSVIYPIFWSLWEILYAPIRLVLVLSRFIGSMFSFIFDFMGEMWLLISSICQLATATEATVSTYEVSIWRTLWNDLFSQVFRAIRSIVNGFVAFFVACNRHRLRYALVSMNFAIMSFT